MARDILNEFGPNTPKTQAEACECGGVLPGEEVDVMGYKPPVGPMGINDPKNPGIHGKLRSNDQQPIPGTILGTVGLQPGGRAPLNGGSQGRY